MSRGVDISRVFDEGSAIDEALARAAASVRREARLLQQPLPIWRDGRVVWLSADEIPAEDDAPQASAEQHHDSSALLSAGSQAENGSTG